MLRAAGINLLSKSSPCRLNDAALCEFSKSRYTKLVSPGQQGYQCQEKLGFCVKTCYDKVPPDEKVATVDLIRNHIRDIRRTVSREDKILLSQHPDLVYSSILCRHSTQEEPTLFCGYCLIHQRSGAGGYRLAAEVSRYIQLEIDEELEGKLQKLMISS